MPRLAAYIGPAVRLDAFLLAPANSLARQARALLANPALSPIGGFGLGWRAVDGRPAAYRQPLPPWNDPNLSALGRSLVQTQWLAALHDAEERPPPQPLHDQELLFAAQGSIEDLAHLRADIREFLDPGHAATLTGTGMTEHLFALLRHLLDNDQDLSIEEGLAAIMDLLGDWLQQRRAWLSLLVTDSTRLYAVRHAFRSECPPLSYTLDEETLPDGQMIASVPLTASEFWRPVPAHHILILDPREPPELIDLP